MNCSRIRRRVEKLAAKICSKGSRQHTFDEHCRLMWRRDKRGFLALINGDCPTCVFVTSFERDDAERAARGRAPREHAQRTVRPSHRK